MHPSKSKTEIVKLCVRFCVCASVTVRGAACVSLPSRYSVHIVILVMLSYTVIITSDISNVHR